MDKFEKLMEQLEELEKQLKNFKIEKSEVKKVEEPKEEVKDIPSIKLIKSCLELTSDIESLQEDANMFCSEQFEYYIENRDELDREELVKIKNALDKYYRMYRRIEAFLNRHKED